MVGEPATFLRISESVQLQWYPRVKKGNWIMETHGFLGKIIYMYAGFPHLCKRLQWGNPEGDPSYTNMGLELNQNRKITT